MYPPELVAPMKEELTSVGYKQLVTAADVDEQMKAEGTTLVMINSVCGCAAGNARPAAIMATNSAKNQIILLPFLQGLMLKLCNKQETICCLTLLHRHRLRFLKTGN